MARLLREEGSRAFDGAVGRLAEGASGALTHVTDRLTDVAENDGRLLGGGPSAGVGGMSAAAALMGLTESSVTGRAAGKAKDAAKGLVGGKAEDAAKGAGGKAEDAEDEAEDSAQGSKGGGIKAGDPKVTNIIEVLDIGMPLRTVYDFYTQYEDFGDVVKGVQSVTKDDDITSKWKVKIAFSNRSFEATVQEQVPDERIVWTSEGSKGSTNGAVSFHELGPTLTRIVAVVEYYPSGFFEKTGNLWRAQGRRLRLDLKHFQRYVTLTDEEAEGWRGEIRDGEVVRSDEEARDAESQDEDEADDTADDDGEPADEEDADDTADDEYRDDDEEFEDEDEDVDDDEDDDDDEEDDGEEYEDEEDEDEDEKAPAR
ncbi:SRPBCC family protein [Streptomyces sp. NBC_01497]|uniref:SRPBCC family protein n=1 Tax=Streptomyces sp. NBC_01497 TaxID=2903885 RepID=UPI002E328888|nr:SRPBCC family protein [Streptomyces sp. NBC_01497]